VLCHLMSSRNLTLLQPYRRRSQAAKDNRERELNLYMRTLTPDDVKRENAFQSHPQRYSRPSSLPEATAQEWRHRAHGQATLGNLTGPNGEQLTSTDPHNTTVFVGGLSPLVGRETVRATFAPFGEIQHVRPFFPTITSHKRYDR
jgi:hypothetical protein